MGLELQLVESHRYRGITSTAQAAAFRLSALPLSIWNDHGGASFQGAVDKGAGRSSRPLRLLKPVKKKSDATVTRSQALKRNILGGLDKLSCLKADRLYLAVL